MGHNVRCEPGNLFSGKGLSIVITICLEIWSFGQPMAFSVIFFGFYRSSVMAVKFSFWTANSILLKYIGSNKSSVMAINVGVLHNQ